MKASDYHFVCVPHAKDDSGSIGLFFFVSKYFWRHFRTASGVKIRKKFGNELKPKAIAELISQQYCPQSLYHNFDAMVGAFGYTGESIAEAREQLVKLGMTEMPALQKFEKRKLYDAFNSAKECALWDAMQEMPTRDPQDVVGGMFVAFPIS